MTEDATRFAAPLSTLPPPKSSRATTSLADTLPDLNRTACPSERETQPERHFRLWDEKLAQALRLSAQGLPRTENESWYAVTKHIHVFSAFFAANQASTIIVTSLVRSHEPRINGTPIRHPPLVCIIQTSNRTIQRKAHILLTWTFDMPSFKNALILCPSPNWMQHLGVDLTLVPFKLLMNTAVEHEHVHAHGQMPSVYDCMFRSLSKMEYIVHVDIDELIVPLPNFSIPAIVQEAERKMKRPLGSLVVPMRYHCLEYPTNMRYSSDELLPLQTRLFTYYSFEVYHGGYTKYIARSRLKNDGIQDRKKAAARKAATLKKK
ncbi:hypothetical protein HPB49_021023 [Dermacentor silvarum]|uniref:Uncharacterized protein n=1 Tax=Dermacentor silvarum TaxID=543639 RepID=A0ACB8C5H8_DERSI|nr:hypothetical protein HPB49_021023 [Dermacentor silvarum]